MVDKKTGEVGEKKRFADTQTKEFMQPLLDNPEFQEYVKKKYEIAYSNIMGENPVLSQSDLEQDISEADE
jgi:hypothetical protein